MDNFACIYKILKTLENALDYPGFDISQISHTKLEVSKERWVRYMEMMSDVELIKGVSVYGDITGETCLKDEGIRITIKGLEYLTENSLMQKACKLAKGIKDVTPFI